MRIIHSVAEMAALPSQSRRGFVPTMGALHEGHLSLIRRARDLSGETIVSIFVNPTQFGPNEDLSRYPRPWEDDVAMCQSAGVDVLFAPQAEDMYPADSQTKVVMGEIAERLEGKSRPGHFDGVATVVLKLFQIVLPQVAVFGKKDRQQCAVISRMVEDLNVPVHLEFAETVREPSGLALSSRNRYFSPTDRMEAARLSQTLFESAERIRSGDDIGAVLTEASRTLSGAGFEPEYVEFASATTFRPLRDFSEPGILLAAAHFRGVRLIDNVDI
jgi:pantoate--beta-alanine ligase